MTYYYLSKLNKTNPLSLLHGMNEPISVLSIANEQQLQELAIPTLSCSLGLV